MRPFISTNVSYFLMGSLHEYEMLGLIMLNRYDIRILLLTNPLCIRVCIDVTTYKDKDKRSE